MLIFLMSEYSLGFLQLEVEPVDLRHKDSQVADITVPGQVGGHFVQRNAKIPSVLPVHVGEDQDPTHDERDQN